MIQALLYDLSVAVLDIKASFKLCGDVMLATSKSVVAAESLWKWKRNGFGGCRVAENLNIQHLSTGIIFVNFSDAA